jgi:hypothetical protein
MSRYMIDKLLLAIDRTDESLEEFAADTPSFLDRWERSAAHPTPPYPEGGTLTPEERAAFESWDYARLYEMGAHPYLLWHMVRGVFVPARMSSEELIEEYRAAVTPLGRPDFTT